MTLSVIIPTLDEEAVIDGCLDEVHAGARGHPLQVIVCDGGSRDRTVERVEQHRGVALVRSARGRGTQMNAGARLATGECLLFLHADCRPGTGYADAILEATTRAGDGGCRAGAFEIQFAHTSFRARLGATLANLRARYSGIPYGDHGLFVTRSAFDEAGGFPDWPLLEDVELARRLRRRGPLALLRQPRITASARRMLAEGLVASSLRNYALLAGLAAGISPSTLERFYPARR